MGHCHVLGPRSEQKASRKKRAWKKKTKQNAHGIKAARTLRGVHIKQKLLADVLVHIGSIYIYSVLVLVGDLFNARQRSKERDQPGSEPLDHIAYIYLYT